MNRGNRHEKMQLPPCPICHYDAGERVQSTEAPFLFRVRCNACGVVFDEPYIREYSDPRPDGFREHFKQVLCPVCFEPYFREMEETEDDSPENL